MSSKISSEERGLISAAYKNFAGNKRAELRVVNAIEGQEHMKENNLHEDLAKEYRATIEQELHHLCSHVITLIDTQLLTKAVDIEDKVFYYKMKGDYYRYIHIHYIYIIFTLYIHYIHTIFTLYIHYI